MKVKLGELWQALRSSYWFVPGMMTLGAAALALGMVALDGYLGDEAAEALGWIYSGGPDGARGVLSTIAGSMITVAGVTFSVLIVALSQAAAQFGSRVLVSFMRDTGNQFVLGAFVGTFLYCVLVLRTVRGGEDPGTFVPHLSVTGAVALAVLGVGVLIYFVHHAAVSIQVSSVIASVSSELHAGIERVFPAEEDAEDAGAGGDAPPRDGNGEAVLAGRDGYVQALDADRLVGTARKAGAVVRVERGPGDFVAAGDALATVHGAAGADRGLERAVRRAFVLGPRRTPGQDVEFSVDQLVDVAVRALSPGINDPFTAATCVDRLGAALARVAERPDARRCHRDGEGSVRVVREEVPGFERLMDAAFAPVRHYAGGSSLVLLRLLDALARVAGAARDDHRRTVVRGHAARVAAAAARELADADDRAAVLERHRRVEEALG